MELRTDRYSLRELIQGNEEKKLQSIKEVNPQFAEHLSGYAQRFHKKLDEIEFVRKGIPIDPKDIDVKEGERAAVRFITTPRLDRDGEILIPDGAFLDDFRQSPSVLFGHDYKALPIGKDIWIKPERGGILAKTVYANHAFAEDVFQCVRGGFLNSNSVGFIPVEAVTPDDKKAFQECQERLENVYGVSKDESGKAKNIYTRWILLEHSDVPVASNAQSLNVAVSKGELKLSTKKIVRDLEIEVVGDAELEDTPDNFPALVAKKSLEYEGKKIMETDDREIEVELDAECAECKDKPEETEEKPETLERYHHIPVNPGCKITATITISEKEGIKATYCGEEKKIHTYLFDKEKWTMEEAKRWVEEHKDEFAPPKYMERWNLKLSKLFDVQAVESPAPKPFNYDLYEKFLECKVKEIFSNGFEIPCPLLGTYLSGFKEALKGFELKDTRNFLWNGVETPPDYAVLQLNSSKSDDFLVDGTEFYDAGGRPLIVKYYPDWTGINITLVTAMKDREWNKELMESVHRWVDENNFLRGEKFSLSGEFLGSSDDEWENLVLEKGFKESVQKSANVLKKKGKDMVGRGLLFIGPPGTGKTKTGRVMMNTSDSTFIWVSSRDFRHVGPLRAITLGYSMARDLAPTVLFIEDIDVWLKDYGDRDSVVVDLLKTEMDGLRQNKGIVTVLTSNYPEKLPDALLDRPGRFHHIVNFELPKAEQRAEMLRLWAGEIGGKLLKEILDMTAGFSGAHMKELVEFASIIAEEDGVEMGEALVRSLRKLTEQRELIEEIRQNSSAAKSVWSRVKYMKGEVKVMDEEIEIEVETGSEEKQEEYECECIECGHKLTSEKHCKDIKCPECGGEMRRVERPGPGRAVEDAETKGIIPYKDLGKADEGESWDGPGETAKADVDDLKAMCAWYDAEKPDVKSSYKLPHHKAEGHAAVWKGVAAAMAALLGARGGTAIPASDRKGVYSHLKAHYGQFGKEAPEFKEYDEEEHKVIFREVYLDESARLIELLKDTKDDGSLRITRELWDVLMIEIKELREIISEFKEGRVLSRKNRQTIKDAIAAQQKSITELQNVLKADAAGTAEEKPEEEGKEVGEIEVVESEELSEDQVTAISQQKVKEALEKIDMADVIKKAVDDKLDKMRGVVR